MRKKEMASLRGKLIEMKTIKSKIFRLWEMLMSSANIRKYVSNGSAFRQVIMLLATESAYRDLVAMAVCI